MQISRRSFLHITGASLLSAGLFSDNLLHAAPAALEPVVGRVLAPVPVLMADGRVLRHLWPDSMVRIAGTAGDHYRLSGGKVLRRMVQPMLAYRPEAALVPEAMPAPVTVVAPVAPIRAWAALDAPLVARVGYGGVLLAVDALSDDTGMWYAVCEATAADTIIGWTPGHRWSAVATGKTPAVRDSQLLLDCTGYTVSLQSHGQTVARFPAAVGPDVVSGQWTIEQRSAGGMVAGQHGAAWRLGWLGGVLYGAHWHHDQGGPGDDEGWGVAPWAARWLYQRVTAGMQVVIR